jgi:hypothetical protein
MFEDLVRMVVPFRDYAFRNIPTLIESESLLDDLTDDPSIRAVGEALVAGRAPTEEHPIISRPFRYGTAFSPEGLPSMQTRFSDGRRFGVWYGCLDVATTVYETVYHWQTFLSNAGIEPEMPLVAHRVVYRVLASGIFVDLRGKERDAPELVSTDNYEFTQRLGNYLYDNRQAGLLVVSARRPKRVNLAVFSPDALSDPRHEIYLSYHWLPGQASILVRTVKGKLWGKVEPFLAVRG